MISGAVKHARNYTDNVEFSCEDATRTDIDYLCTAVDVAVRSGATTINIPRHGRVHDSRGVRLHNPYARKKRPEPRRRDP